MKTMIKTKEHPLINFSSKDFQFLEHDILIYGIKFCRELPYEFIQGYNRITSVFAAGLTQISKQEKGPQGCNQCPG
jgi:hypothetical protein